MSNFINSLLENQNVRRRSSPFQGKSGSGTFRRDPDMRSFGEARFPSGMDTNGRISRRFHSRQLSKKPAFRPAGVVSRFEQNSRLIEKVKQNPSRVQRSGFFPPEGNKHMEQSGAVRMGATRRSYERKTNGTTEEINTSGSSISGRLPKRRGYFPSFFIPAVPAAALLLLALGIFFVIDSGGGSFAWTHREVVNSPADGSIDYNMALYAGVQSTANSRENSGDAIPLDLMETFSWQSYKVKKGDSVSKIAASFSVSMDAIISSNNISNARNLREGEILRIPNMDGIPYTVCDGDSLNKISISMGVPLEAILDANDLQNDIIDNGMVLFIPGARMKREDLKMALGELFIYPVKGARLSSPFGWRNDPFTGVRTYHAAVDLSVPQGTPIKAAMDGRVTEQGYNGTYGNYIILSHTGELQTMYAHMHTFSVKKGDRVTQGTQIGTVGSTGYSTGPHLHLAVFKNGRAVNPLDLLGK